MVFVLTGCAPFGGNYHYVLCVCKTMKSLKEQWREFENLGYYDLDYTETDIVE